MNGRNLPVSRREGVTVVAEPAAGRVETLSASLEELLVESQRLRRDVHSAEEARKRTNKIGLALIGAVAVFVVLVGLVSWQNNQVLRSTGSTNETIVDCTTPTGDCYRQNLRRTAEVVQNLIKASTYVSQCARLKPGESGPAFDRYLEDCVRAKLLADEFDLSPTATPSPKP